MASSSDEGLDESIPEMVYQCISISDAANYRREDSCVQCPLCNKYQFSNTFHCADCVKNGNFSHSKKKCFERFADKKAKKYKLEQEEEEIITKYQQTLAKKIEVEDMKLNIMLCREKIKLLEKSLNSKREEILNDVKQKEDLKVKKSECLKRQQVISAKISRLRGINEDKEIGVNRLQIKCSYKQQELEDYKKYCIKELVTYIMPITKVPPQLQRYASSSSEEGQYAELEEAQKTTYIQGQWVITGSPMDEIQYAVVEPFIPSSGDYSAYMSWYADHELAISRDNLSEEDRRRFDVAYGIGAALAYTAQIVKVLSYIMDVSLPKRSSYNDFCKHDTARKFYHHVAKLNANIIQLCLARQVDVTQLNAHKTISNLLLLIESKHNERRRSLSLEQREEILESLENFITKDMLPPDESDEDIEAEFVHISDEEDLFLDIPETTTPTPPSSLVSSVFSSFWRAATGQK